MTERREYEVLVVGGGPAGLAAAEAAEGRRRTGLVDDNPALGGQIWRGEVRQRAGGPGEAAEVLTGMPIVDAPRPGVLLAESERGACELRYEKLILATGARERFLPFPGWTMPGVCGAGGLQALVKSGLPIEGKRVLVAGSGPLLLAVARYLTRRGAHIVAIAEQAPKARIQRFVRGLAASPRKLLQAARLRLGLLGVPYLTDTRPVGAEGAGSLESVTLRRGDRECWTEACDYLACGFGLVPNTELARLLGCAIAGGAVKVDVLQKTTVPGVFAAGEITGIGGLEKSIHEGTIAGLSATRDDGRAIRFPRRRRDHESFARDLARTFALDDVLKSLADQKTIVCRCEDVSYGRLRVCDSWREAKLHTRCGMGPCQGRICGPATEFLFGWEEDSIRPPLFPARLETLAIEETGAEMAGSS